MDLRAPNAESARAAASVPDTFGVASWNVHACVGRDRRQDVERIARVVTELGCDAVGLQEVDSRGGPGHASMQLDRLADLTGMTAVPGLTIVRHDGHYGNALLTRLPIRDVRRHDLAVVRFEPRGALEVALDVGGTVVRVVVAHLGLRPFERRLQVRRLLDALGEDDAHPLVLLGDMNEWLPRGRPLRWLHARFGETPAQATFPSARPVFALDRIWVQPRAALGRFDVHRSALARVASDHLPVRAEIALGPVTRPRR